MAIQRVIVALLAVLAVAELFGVVFIVGLRHYVETICYFKINNTLVGIRYVEGKLVVPLNPLFFLIDDSLDVCNVCSRTTALSTNETIATCSCCKFAIDSSRIVFSNIVIGLVLLGSLWTMVRRSEFEVL